MKTQVLISGLLFTAAVFVTPLALSNDLNARPMPNDVNNSITHMRLKALLSKNKGDQDPLGKQTFGGTINQDCTLEIGNNTSQGLLDKPQDIIITGPVINKCR